jgi:hypothetical protein
MTALASAKQRRDLVIQTTGLNGLDYLEVLGATPGCGDQLALTFLKDARGLTLTPANISLTGDLPVQATGVQPATKDDPLTVTVQLSGSGDFAPYTLTLSRSAADPDPPAGIDPMFNQAVFSFKAGCPAIVDCRQSQCCPSDLPTPPDIHYLARDYNGLRQAMIDRLSTLVSGWSETHEADPGITLVEALAFAADRISYLQDSVNTEAYIGTARSRISLRRHARLVDYQIGEGANARALIFLNATGAVTVRKGTPGAPGAQFFPPVPGLKPSIDPNLDGFASDQLTGGPGPVFEPLQDVSLQSEQNEMPFYGWRESSFCLPAGATEATLEGAYPTLVPGQILIFEEILGPTTGDAADADPNRRWAVRLTYASTNDHSTPPKPLTDPTDTSKKLTNIAWTSADALPFPFCVTAVTSTGAQLSAVSVARGNIVPADQGAWTNDESLGVVPAAPATPVADIGCNCAPAPGAWTPQPRFNPTLANSPLTFAVPYDATAPASSFQTPDPGAAIAQIQLLSSDGVAWTATEDLLSKGSEDPYFIPEIEWDGTAHLRFGDGLYGKAPNTTGLAFSATYRTGNGAAGNVGREGLGHVLMAGGATITQVRNPLAAAGGVDPETMQHIVQQAPFAFQSQLRCVTPADYGAQAATLPGVVEARGTMRWTGSWWSAFVSVAPQGAWNASLASEVSSGLDQLRMMGVDLVVEQARYVGLDIALQICVAPNFFVADVRAALWSLLVTGDSCTGVAGLLNEANFQFGQTVYASPIVAAAQSVPGVVAVTLAAFARLTDQPAPGAPPPAQLTMASTEIPCCDNDPDHADRGTLTLIMAGGK